MGEDAYIDESLAESIETIQEVLGLNTFREASKIYDKLARKSTLGDVIQEGSTEEGEMSEVDRVRENLEDKNEELLEKIS